MTDAPERDKRASTERNKPDGAGGVPDEKFPPLDFPGADKFQGVERVRVEPRFVPQLSDRPGAVGTLEVYTLGDCSVGCCYLVLECVEQSELFPGVCNTWRLVWIGGSC